MMEDLIFNEAVELKPGCIYALETEFFLTRKQRAMIEDNLKKWTDKYGIRFILFEGGFQLVTRLAIQQDPSTPDGQ